MLSDSLVILLRSYGRPVKLTASFLHAGSRLKWEPELTCILNNPRMSSNNPGQRTKLNKKEDPERRNRRIVDFHCLHLWVVDAGRNQKIDAARAACFIGFQQQRFILIYSWEKVTSLATFSFKKTEFASQALWPPALPGHW